MITVKQYAAKHNITKQRVHQKINKGIIKAELKSEAIERVMSMLLLTPYSIMRKDLLDLLESLKSGKDIWLIEDAPKG